MDEFLEEAQDCKPWSIKVIPFDVSDYEFETYPTRNVSW